MTASGGDRPRPPSDRGSQAELPGHRTRTSARPRGPGGSQVRGGGAEDREVTLAWGQSHQLLLCGRSPPPTATVSAPSPQEATRHGVCPPCAEENRVAQRPHVAAGLGLRLSPVALGLRTESRTVPVESSHPAAGRAGGRLQRDALAAGPGFPAAVPLDTGREGSINGHTGHVRGLSSWEDARAMRWVGENVSPQITSNQGGTGADLTLIL